MSNDIRSVISETYGAIARASISSKAGRSGCCGDEASPVQSSAGCCMAMPDPEALATAIGYDPAELKKLLPDGANLGLSCGNPAAIAALQPGETVVDLGSGAGFDCFLCGPKVGATGHVIGVDMTPDMLARARGNLASYHQRSGLTNIEFRLGEIEHLPLADASADVIISNCVVNLSPDKTQVWREIARVLKPGGRVAISDMVLLQPLPPSVNDMVSAYVGCIAGASLRDDVIAMMNAAGLDTIHLEPKPAYVDRLSADCDTLYTSVSSSLPANTRLSDYITSMNISARKPGGCCANTCCS